MSEQGIQFAPNSMITEKFTINDSGVALFTITAERRLKVLCEDGEMRFVDDRAAAKLFASLLA